MWCKKKFGSIRIGRGVKPWRQFSRSISTLLEPTRKLVFHSALYSQHLAEWNAIITILAQKVLS